jgi:O-antigen/teichoic acid export membrane protein
MSESENSRRIAKNTLVLYIRMMVLMLIGLFTSRIVLNTLGVADYGTYNVVGGVVAMFAIVTSSLSSAISRFLTIEIGRNDVKQLRKLFSTSIIILFAMSLIIIILIEILGVWFLNTHMNIPDKRMDAANFVMQCSIITFIISLNATPYNATIIAHERMGVFAYITMLDASLKLLIVYSLYVSPFDKLDTYALLLLLESFLMQVIYFVYCRRCFPECRFHLSYDVTLIKQLGGFASWSFFGNASWILNTQGINILINIFFGVTINAARGIASQVDSAMQNFVSNFTTALNPQIMKSYATDDLKYMHKLIFAGARYSFFLILFFSIPICLETHRILLLWLKQVPEYSVIFVRLSLVATMMVTISNTLTTSQSATGKIRKSAIVTSIFTFLEFPSTYIVFYLGYSPTSTYLIHFIIYFLLIFVKIYLVKDLIKMSVSSYLKEVLSRAFCVVLLALPLPLFIYFYYPSSILRFIVVCLVSGVSTAICVFFIGMYKNERQLIIQNIKRKIFSKSLNC